MLQRLAATTASSYSWAVCGEELVWGSSIPRVSGLFRPLCLTASRHWRGSSEWYSLFIMFPLFLEVYHYHVETIPEHNGHDPSNWWCFLKISRGWAGSCVYPLLLCCLLPGSEWWTHVSSWVRMGWRKSSELAWKSCKSSLEMSTWALFWSFASIRGTHLVLTPPSCPTSPWGMMEPNHTWRPASQLHTSRLLICLISILHAHGPPFLVLPPQHDDSSAFFFSAHPTALEPSYPVLYLGMWRNTTIHSRYHIHMYNHKRQASLMQYFITARSSDSSVLTEDWILRLWVYAPENLQGQIWNY